MFFLCSGMSFIWVIRRFCVACIVASGFLKCWLHILRCDGLFIWCGHLTCGSILIDLSLIKYWSLFLLHFIFFFYVHFTTCRQVLLRQYLNSFATDLEGRDLGNQHICLYLRNVRFTSTEGRLYRLCVCVWIYLLITLNITCFLFKYMDYMKLSEIRITYWLYDYFLFLLFRSFFIESVCSRQRSSYILLFDELILCFGICF